MTTKNNTRVYWDELISKSEKSQVDLINEILKEHKPKKLSELEDTYFGVKNGTISHHFSHLGYKYLKKQYVKKTKDDQVKVTEGHGSESLGELYKTINEIASGNEEYQNLTVKVTKHSAKVLNEFLKSNKILNKQAVLSAAIVDFVEKYS